MIRALWHRRSKIKPTRRSLGTITSIEGARQSSSSVPLAELEKYRRPPR